MNLRILKKLSKRAAPLLPLLGDKRGQFLARKDLNYTGILIKEWKCWERIPTHPSNPVGPAGGGAFRVQARAGHKYVLAPHCYPLKGTVMVGAMGGYYEPEWEEQSAYEALQDIVFCHFMTCDEEMGELGLSRPLSLPSQVFSAAADLLTEERAGQKARAN